LKRRRSILTLGAFLIFAAAILLGLSLWGIDDGFDWDMARCARLPDHWLPEFAWAFASLIAATALLAGGAAFQLERSGGSKRASGVWLAVSGLFVIGALVLVIGLRFGSCPTVA
jgi:hypothetical protein